MDKTLCFIPCCKRKTKHPCDPSTPQFLTEKCIPNSWQSLETGRQRMRACLDLNISQCPALDRYDGNLYKSESNFREAVLHQLKTEALELYIISAGYGIVHALDPIHPYEAEMKGSNGRLWRDVGLVSVISELICTSSACQVFGFFAGPSNWAGAHAKYRYFFTEGVKMAIANHTTLDKAVCFFRESGWGSNAINGALGRTLIHGLRAKFSSRFLSEYTVGRLDGNVVIRSEIVHESF